jgi:molybdate transport system ATP-binding protein
VVVDSVDDAHPALTLVKLRVGESPLLARLTRRSAHALEIVPGQLLYAQIKAVALIGGGPGRGRREEFLC